MTQYIGFSTLGSNKPQTAAAATGVDGGVGGIVQPIIPGKKYRLVDEALVIQDLINAFNISRGQKVGQPDWGTDLWNYVFEPNDANTQFKLEDEIRRVISTDPRLALNSVKSYPQENGILIEVEVAVVPFNVPVLVNIMFDQLTNTASRV